MCHVLVFAAVILGYAGLRTLLTRGGVEEQSAETDIALEKGEWVTFRALYATPEQIAYEHSMSGLIPIGTEHFYFVFSADGSTVATVRATKKWYDDNFENLRAIDPEGVVVTGYVRATETKVQRELLNTRDTLQKELDGVTIAFQSGLYIDTIATRMASFETILAFAPLLLLGVCLLGKRAGLFDRRAKSFAGRTMIVTLAICALAYCGLMIHTVSMF